MKGCTQCTHRIEKTREDWELTFDYCKLHQCPTASIKILGRSKTCPDINRK